MSADASLLRRAAVLLVIAVVATVVVGVTDNQEVLHAHETDPVHSDTHTAICAALITADSETSLRSDCEVLLGFKDTLQGPVAQGATAPLNWGDTGVAFAAWKGITTSGTGASKRVTEIDLNGTFPLLSGEIPAALGDLTGLTTLKLAGNLLSGGIPAELGNLSNLTDLELYNNSSIAGTIPVELGNLTSLENLWLFNINLTGTIPAELGNLTNLATLRLNANQLTGSIPAELGNLTSLGNLSLGVNRLTGSIPAELGNLTNLTVLYLARNPLTSGPMPTWVYDLTNLTGLYMHDVGLTSISSDLANLNSLSLLWLHENKLTGEIPSWLGTMTALTDLDLSDNEFTGGIPQEYSSLTNLVYLWMGGNQLTGSIPTWLGNMTDLRQLVLRNNQLSGAIPAELRNLTGLTQLNLQNNQLSGSIPAALGDLTALREMNLSNNRLTGSIPAELGNIETIFDLRLSGNRLSGSIPSELGSKRQNGTAKSLYTLHLNDNNLSGSIPSELGQLTRLQYLLLNGNELSGAVPSEIGNILRLRDLHLHHNDLEGDFPEAVRALRQLNSLSLDPGQIPNDGMWIMIYLSFIFLDLPDDPTPSYADAERTYVTWLYASNADYYDSAATATLPAGASLADEPVYYQVALQLFDRTGNPIQGGQLPQPAVVCVSNDTNLRADPQQLFSLNDGSPTWRLLPTPVATRTIQSACGETRDLSTFVTGLSTSAPTDRTSDIALKWSVDSAAGTFVIALGGGEVIVSISVPPGAVASGEVVEFTIQKAQGPSPRGFAVPSSPDIIEITLADGDELVAPVTVCMEAVEGLEGVQVLLHLGDGPASRWVALPRPAVPPAGYESGWVCGVTSDFSKFMVAAIDPAAINRVARILRVEPSIRSATVSVGDLLRLELDVYGVQDILDNKLEGIATAFWSDGSGGGSFDGSGRSVLYTAPSSPGENTVTAFLSSAVCRGTEEQCTAKFEIRVRRPSVAPPPTPVPINPAGNIPSILADDQGRQYEVFTPVSGGSFQGEGISITAGPGAAPNGEIVGLRMHDAGPASNIGMTAQRYTLVGSSYDVPAVDATGAAISFYVLNAPAEVCVPLPPEARRNISDVALVVNNPDGTLTILSASVRIVLSGVNVCGNLSTLPATIAVGVAGAPTALPTPTPESGEATPPDTGGRAPSDGALTLLLLMGIFAVAAGAWGLAHTRRRARVRQR